MIGISEIEKHFHDDAIAEVAQLLAQYTGPESTRVKRSILTLAAGDMFRLQHYLDAAMTDYRDVLYWSEHPDG